MKEKVVKFFATGFGAGYLPWAPGTYGTIVAIPFAYYFHFLGPLRYMFLTFTLIGFAIFVSDLACVYFGEDDSPKIVIDEIVGYLVTMTWLPATWQAFTLGFLLFRFFDAVKPGPISYLDRKVKGGLGVVVDDVAAGLVSNIIMQLVYVYTPILGARYQ